MVSLTSQPTAVVDNAVIQLLQRPAAAIMGVVNTTPDSFSDGGKYLETDQAVAHALELVAQGADILDVGGESTRPGAAHVSLQEELDRVIPVIEQIVQETHTPISIDTYKPQVMAAAVAAGAVMINDINALRADGALAAAANASVPVCLMHMQGQPATMQKSPHYVDVVQDVTDFLLERIEACVTAGIGKQSIVIDPGIGFGKSLQHNLSLLAAVPELIATLNCAVLIGVSRKSMIDTLLGRPVQHREPASIGLAVQAVLNGARIVRVHNVRATYDAIRAVEAVAQLNLDKALPRAN